MAAGVLARVVHTRRRGGSWRVELGAARGSACGGLGTIWRLFWNHKNEIYGMGQRPNRTDHHGGLWQWQSGRNFKRCVREHETSNGDVCGSSGTVIFRGF
jgi:hypothetical protein